MSKKLASGADRILLDVKTGSGAFMKTLDDSIRLAYEMVSIGHRSGKETAALITNMDMPLGNAIGNSLEVIEAIDTLKGKGPQDLQTVAVELAACMLELAEVGDRDYSRELAKSRIRDGSALAKFKEMVEAQGGVFSDDTEKMFGRPAEIEYDVRSPSDGYIKAVKADSLGIASMILGAGRETKESGIDHSAGIMLLKKPGMKVEKGETIAKLFTNKKESIDEARDIVLNATDIGKDMPMPRPLILAYVNHNSMIKY